MDHRERSDKLEREAEELEEHSDRLGDDIDDAKKNWESKQQDESVPGAQPEPQQESQQRPEEAPPEQVVDEGGSDEDESAESPGVPGEEGQATGHSENAG